MRRLSITVVGICGLFVGCSTDDGSISESVLVSTSGAPTATDALPAPTDSTATTVNSTTTVTPAATAPSVPIDTPIARATVAFTLPDGFEYPEGIAVDPVSGRAYVTSSPTGAVAVAEPGADTASVWLPAGKDGRTLTLGIEFDRDSVWLVSPPAIYEYAVDGALRGRHVAEESGFLNDLAITDQGIYVTDVSKPTLWFLPRNSVSDAPLVAIDLSMTQDAMGQPFQLNGIEALDDGTLVAVHFYNGLLFHIDARPLGAYTIATIDLGGYLLTLGDGMRAQGHVLWVTRGAADDTIDRIALCPSNDCGTVVAGTPDAALSFPTDVELRGDQLLVVNSQFDNGGGLGDGVPTKPFFVSAISIMAP